MTADLPDLIADVEPDQLACLPARERCRTSELSMVQTAQLRASSRSGSLPFAII